MKVLKETHKRSIAKSITWRVSGSLATTIIVFLFTKRLLFSLGVGVVELISKMCLYYLHERLWSKVSWGCVTHPLSKISLKREPTPEDMSIISKKLKELGYID